MRGLRVAKGQVLVLFFHELNYQIDMMLAFEFTQ